MGLIEFFQSGFVGFDLRIFLKSRDRRFQGFLCIVHCILVHIIVQSILCIFQRVCKCFPGLIRIIALLVILVGFIEFFQRRFIDFDLRIFLKSCKCIFQRFLSIIYCFLVHITV